MTHTTATASIARDPMATPAPTIRAPFRFPATLRKMWTGGEVQEWLDREYARIARTDDQIINATIEAVAFLSGKESMSIGQVCIKTVRILEANGGILLPNADPLEEPKLKQDTKPAPHTWTQTTEGTRTVEQLKAVLAEQEQLDFSFMSDRELRLLTSEALSDLIEAAETFPDSDYHMASFAASVTLVGECEKRGIKTIQVRH